MAHGVSHRLHAARSFGFSGVDLSRLGRHGEMRLHRRETECNGTGRVPSPPACFAALMHQGAEGVQWRALMYCMKCPDGVPSPSNMKGDALQF